MATLEKATDLGGELRMVDLESLHIDSHYQRTISLDLVHEIASNWRAVAAQALMVSERTNGDLYVVNGQHRMSAAMMLGIKELPAIVVTGLNREGEAELRLRTNVALSDRSLDRFRAQLAAKSSESLAIQRILKSYDTQINMVARSDGGINCVSTVEWIYRIDKGVLLGKVLALINDTWGTPESDRVSAALLKGFAWFLAQHAGECDLDRFKERIGHETPMGLRRKAITMKGVMGGADWLNLYRALVETYNYRLTTANMLETRARGARGGHSVHYPTGDRSQ